MCVWRSKGLAAVLRASWPRDHRLALQAGRTVSRSTSACCLSLWVSTTVKYAGHTQRSIMTHVVNGNCEEQVSRPWTMCMFAAKEVTDPCRGCLAGHGSTPGSALGSFSNVRTPGFSRVTAALSRKSPALLAGKACQIGIHHGKQAVQMSPPTVSTENIPHNYPVQIFN